MSSLIALGKRQTLLSHNEFLNFKNQKGFCKRFISQLNKKSNFPALAMTVPEATKYLKSVSISVPYVGSYMLSIALKSNRRAPSARGQIAFPHPFQEPPKICVFAKGAAADEALKSGATYVGAEDLVKKIQTEPLEFSKCFAHPNSAELLPQVAKLLGSKRLMPSIKRGTISDELKPLIESALTAVDYRQNDAGSINLPVGKLGFSDKELQENIEALVSNVRFTLAKLPGKVKVTVKHVHLSASHAIAIPLQYK